MAMYLSWPAAPVASHFLLLLSTCTPSESMCTLRPEQANVLWLWAVTIFYGGHLTLFIAACYILVPRWRASRTQRVLFALIIILFVLSTISAAISVAQATETADTLVIFRGQQGETRVQVRERKVFAVLTVVSDVVMIIANAIADGLVVWRSYVICRRSTTLATVLAVLLVIGTGLECVVAALDSRGVSQRLASPSGERTSRKDYLHDATVIGYFQLVSWGFSVLINVTATITIGWDLWRARQAKRAFAASTRGFSLILNLIIESGVPYLVSIIVSIMLKTAPAATCGGLYQP
ncbi:hypothetical protein OE88DRAFT_1233607 [Heliocybe sulcata]|uniref:Family A G protein-coupled receptor-like protein n=1 Tax=Heliocybe sulcata TaxID=5364 RepID=A0A5C3N7N5_9AGAM|nr:hypothetical protein OE88DRAFT_1233607 [Heliocybe sulcata]